MTHDYPRTIESGGGESLTFTRRVTDASGDWLEVSNVVQPGAGPPMHVHHRQAEGLTVVSGRIGVQILGQAPTEHGPGETVEFAAGVAHRFWAAGTEPLVCTGWVRPAHNVEYFLTEIFRSTRENGGRRPRQFDAAYLTQRYAGEFDMVEIPAFVKRVVLPLIVRVGMLFGKHARFRDAPPPVTP